MILLQVIASATIFCHNINRRPSYGHAAFVHCRTGCSRHLVTNRAGNLIVGALVLAMRHTKGAALWCICLAATLHGLHGPVFVPSQSPRRSNARSPTATAAATETSRWKSLWDQFWDRAVPAGSNGTAIGTNDILRSFKRAFDDGAFQEVELEGW